MLTDHDTASENTILRAQSEHARTRQSAGKAHIMERTYYNNPAITLQ